jgi:hypothetical protein
VFSGVLTAEEFGRGDKGSGDTTVVDVQTLQEAFLNRSPSFACFSSQDIFFGNTLLKCWYISISRFSDGELKKFCCICNKCTLTLRNEKSQIRKIQAF